MKIIKLGLVGLLTAMLSFALVGCSGGGSAGGGDEAKAAFAGSWELIEVTGENGASAEDIELMKSMDLTVSLQLKDDGTGTFNLFGESMDATWEASSTTEGTITLEGDTVNMTIADGKLTMTQGGDEMVFQKGDSAASDSAASSAEASSAPAEEAASSAPAEASSAPAEEAASSAPAEEAASSEPAEESSAA